MSYLAIARKYRPATFEEIVGQRHVTRTLTNAIASDRIHHAYLFTGARGVGKTTAARALSRALNCEQGPTVTPCGVCPSCIEISAGMSPDLIEIDGASNNSVDDVREIRDAVHYAPTRGRRKIYLIDEVHMLSKGAFNALLKTLEEPPPHIVFIFATTEPNKIPETILSRVQRFDFKRIALPEVVERLAEIATAEGVKIGPAGLRMIARAGEGSMRDAQSLLDQVIAYGGSEITDPQIQETLGLIDHASLHRFLGGLIRGEPGDCLEVIDVVYNYGHELSVFTAEILELLRHATFVRLSPEARRFVDLAQAEIDALDALTEGADPEHLSRLFSAMLQVHEQVSHASRPRIVLEMACARLATVRPAPPLAGLLDRLEQLERSLRDTPPPARRGAPPAARPPAGPERSAPRLGGRPRPREPQEPSLAEPIRPSPTTPPTPKETPSPPEDPWATAGGPDVPLAEIDLSAPTPLGSQRRPQGRPLRAGSPAARWQAFCEDLERTDPEAHRALSVGDPLLQGDRLRLQFPPGRGASAARRASARPSVARALASRYAGVTLSIEMLATPSAGPSAELERAFLADPDMQRIVRALGATVERVEPSTEPSPPSEESAP